MSEIILGGTLLAIISAPAFFHLWREAQRKKEESLKKAKLLLVVGSTEIKDQIAINGGRR